MTRMNMFLVAAVAALTFAFACSASAQQQTNLGAYKMMLGKAAIAGNKVAAANAQTADEWAAADKLAWALVTNDSQYAQLNEREQAKVRGAYEAAAIGASIPADVVNDALAKAQTQGTQAQAQRQTTRLPDYPTYYPTSNGSSGPVVQPGSTRIFLGGRRP